MNSPSQSQPSAEKGPQPSSPQAQCDLCQGVMTIPAHCVQSGLILGLLVCGQCLEDQLQSEVIQ